MSDFPRYLASSVPFTPYGIAASADVQAAIQDVIDGVVAVGGNAASATYAAAATVVDDTTTNATMYPVWVTANTGNLPNYVSSTKLSFNPSTGLLTSTGFSGPLTGNVTGNASGSSGTCTGLAGSATYAVAATITNDATTNATMYPVWVTANTGNLPHYVASTKLSFNPSTGLLTATGFSGPLTGNVTGNASGSSGTCTGLAGSSTYAVAATITNDATTNATMYPVWVTANTGNLPHYVASTKLSFNPSTGLLTVTGFSGPLTGNVTGNVSGSSGSCTGNAASATYAAAATVVDDTTTNATMYPVWMTAVTGNLALKASSTKLSFNPSTGLLTATGFSGPLTGNVTGNASGSSGTCTGNAGSATYAAATTITDDTTTNATMYPLWATANTGNLATKVSSTKLSFNPSTGRLTATSFGGALTGNVTGNASGSSGTCTGLAGSATVLATPRAINGVNFDGSAPITVTADANTLSNTTLKSTVVSSGLTSVGTLTGLYVTGADSLTLVKVAGATMAARFNLNTLGAWIEGVDQTGVGGFQPLAVGGSILQMMIAGVEKARVHSDGNVGIGTAAPDQALSVLAAVNITTGNVANLSLSDSTAIAAGTGGAIIFRAKYTGSTYTELAAIQGGKDTVTDGEYGGQLKFFTRLNGGGYVGAAAHERMRISGDGNISLGYNAATANLVQRTFATAHAAGNRGASLGFGMTDGSYAGMLVTDKAADNASYNAQYVTFSTHEGGYSAGERMRIDSYGKVGIGTTAPASTLDVNGFWGSRETSLTLANGRNDNITPLSSFVRIIGPTAGFQITGVTGGVDGRIVTFFGGVPYNWEFDHDNANSTAANRVYTYNAATTYLSNPWACATLQYSAAVSRWILISVAH